MEIENIHALGLTQLKHVKPLGLYELNGRPVVIRLMPGVGKCSLCARMAKLTVFEIWGGKRLDSDASQLHRVWHWCGECEESPFPPFGQDPH